MSYGFREEHHPPAWLRTEAESTASRAARELGLPPVSVKFWRYVPGAPPWLGWADFYTDIGEQVYVVNLVVDKLPDSNEVRSVTAHECRHLWQSMTSRFIDSEPDACRFAYELTGVLPVVRVVGE